MGLTVAVPGQLVLAHHVDLDLNGSTIFSFKAEPVHNVIISVFIKVAGPHKLFDLQDSDGASQEEGVDFGLERSSGSPCLDFEFVEAWF